MTCTVKNVVPDSTRQGLQAIPTHISKQTLILTKIIFLIKV
jgi:hypothetical protein